MGLIPMSNLSSSTRSRYLYRGFNAPDALGRVDSQSPVSASQLPASSNKSSNPS
jgi:hypothetical protein